MAASPILTASDVVNDAAVIPVIVVDDVSLAVPMAQALVAGGYPHAGDHLAHTPSVSGHGGYLQSGARIMRWRRYRAPGGGRARGRQCGRSFCGQPGLYRGSGASLSRCRFAVIARRGHGQRNHGRSRGWMGCLEVLPGCCCRGHTFAQGMARAF